MSKPTGLSRVRRKGRAVKELAIVPKVVPKNGSNSRQLSNLFSDFDLSDISVNLNANQNNVSFKSTKIVMNEELIEDNSNESTKWPSLECVDKPINGFNPCLDDTNASTSVTSFTKSSMVSNNSHINESNGNSNKRKNLSVVFDDIDLSDLNINFNQTNASFKSSRKVFKTDINCNFEDKTDIDSNEDNNNNNAKMCSVFNDMDLSDLNQTSHLSAISFQSSRKVTKTDESTDKECNENNGQQIDIDLSECFAEPFGETQEVFRRCSQNSASKSDENELNCLFSSSDDQFFDDIDQTDQPLNSTTIPIQEPQLEEEFNDDLKDLTQDMDFLLKNDFFDDMNEELVEEIEREVESVPKSDVQNCDNEQKCEMNVSYNGFQTVSGKTIEFNENDRSKAELLFKDIEEWLTKEIIENKNLKNLDSSDETYSQVFILKSVESGRQKVFELKSETPTKPSKCVQINDSKTNESIGEPFEHQLESEWQSMKTSYKFEPFTARPTDLPLITAKAMLNPMTSTPKTSSVKRKINFEPKNVINFAQKFNDL